MISRSKVTLVVMTSWPYARTLKAKKRIQRLISTAVKIVSQSTGPWRVPDHRLLDGDRPILVTRFDLQTIKARVFVYVCRTTAWSPVFDRDSERPPADLAVDGRQERSRAGRLLVLCSPLDAPLPALDVERFGLRISTARERSDWPPSH